MLGVSFRAVAGLYQRFHVHGFIIPSMLLICNILAPPVFYGPLGRSRSVVAIFQLSKNDCKRSDDDGMSFDEGVWFTDGDSCASVIAVHGAEREDEHLVFAMVDNVVEIGNHKGPFPASSFSAR